MTRTNVQEFERERDGRLTATIDADAAILLRQRVNQRALTPSRGDCILLNAALHVEGRHVARCSVCGDRAHYGDACPHRYTEPHAS